MILWGFLVGRQTTKSKISISHNTVAQRKPARLVIGRTKRPKLKSPCCCFLVHRVMSLSKIFAPTGSVDLSQSSFGIDKLSTSFGRGHGGKLITCVCVIMRQKHADWVGNTRQLLVDGQCTNKVYRNQHNASLIKQQQPPQWWSSRLLMCHYTCLVIRT